MRSASGPEYANPPSSSKSAGPVIESVPRLQRADPAAEAERARVLSELETAIESFRRGKTAKTTTISEVLRLLGEDVNVSLTPSQKDATFNSYLTEILSIQSTFDESGRVSVEKSGSLDRTANVPEGRDKGKPKRFHEDAESDSDVDDDKPTKRQKLLESDMPWFTSKDESSSGDSNPSCQETRRLLRAYNRDISKAKFFVKIAPKSPSGIPSSQWERIFKGDAVDLNQFLASLHHVVPDEERTGRLGDTEISFGVPESKKKVRTFMDWAAAWRRASSAIGFAFPHRKQELLEYGDYIQSEFESKHLSAHSKIILYDIAVRNEVAAGQNFLLTDAHRFNRLYSAIILPEGVEVPSTQSAGKKSANSSQGGSKPEICNKFNQGTCKNSDAECKYRHICKGCKKSGHASKDCKEGSK
jgi:hypothetical protein